MWPDAWMSGDNAKKSEKLPRLEWQDELDASMAAIDDRLTHPRRRATDANPSSTQGAGERLSPEMMDEIAWRVAEQIRRQQQSFPPQASPAAAPPPVTPAPALRPGKMLMIRYRMPSLPWPLRLLTRRKRQHPLTTAKLRA